MAGASPPRRRALAAHAPALTTEEPRGAAPVPAPSYTVIDLGTFGTVQSAQAFELNEAGHVVGYAAARPFLWQNGAKTDLGTLGGPSAMANALNDNGQIVGHSTFAVGSPGHAVLWQNGTITNLTPDLPAGQGSSATGINEAGQIVGNIGYTEAFLWENGARTSLGRLGGGGSFASDINDSRIVVGSSSGRPFAWQNGVMTDLGLSPATRTAAPRRSTAPATSSARPAPPTPRPTRSSTVRSSTRTA